MIFSYKKQFNNKLTTKEKNKMAASIKDCRNCPNVTLKFLNNENNGMEKYMYCQTAFSCIQLRKHWDICPIPKWCPRLVHRVSICGKRI